MKSLTKSHSDEIHSAYVIYLPDNSVSEFLSQRAVQSCNKVGQPVKLWPGFDGTSGQIVPPQSLQEQSWIRWIKVMDHWQSPTEIACSLSHISLWVHCIEIDQPIIVLEHDAIMTQVLARHGYRSAVQYLGCAEQLNEPQPLEKMIYSTINQNWWFINRAHAYSIDPGGAKKLLISVMQRGIYESLDVMINLDVVAIIQNGIYAYDDPAGVTTITDRKQTGQTGPGQLRV